VRHLTTPGSTRYWTCNPEPSVESTRSSQWCGSKPHNALPGLPDIVSAITSLGIWQGRIPPTAPGTSSTSCLRVRVGAYSIRGRQRPSRARVKVWRDVKLPDGKNPWCPGFVSHATNVVEHPEVVADRILNFAGWSVGETSSRHRLWPSWRQDPPQTALGEARQKKKKRLSRAPIFATKDYTGS